MAEGESIPGMMQFYAFMCGLGCGGQGVFPDGPTCQIRFNLKLGPDRVCELQSIGSIVSKRRGEDPIIIGTIYVMGTYLTWKYLASYPRLSSSVPNETSNIGIKEMESTQLLTLRPLC